MRGQKSHTIRRRIVPTVTSGLEGRLRRQALKELSAATSRINEEKRSHGFSFGAWTKQIPAPAVILADLYSEAELISRICDHRESALAIYTSADNTLDLTSLFAESELPCQSLWLLGAGKVSWESFSPELHLFGTTSAMAAQAARITAFDSSSVSAEGAAQIVARDESSVVSHSDQVWLQKSGSGKVTLYAVQRAEIHGNDRTKPLALAVGGPGYITVGGHVNISELWGDAHIGLTDTAPALPAEPDIGAAWLRREFGHMQHRFGPWLRPEQFFAEEALRRK